MRKLSFLLISTLVLLSSCQKKDTAIPIRVIEAGGYTLNSDETWSGIVELKGNVTVPSGRTLTISAGTKVKIADDVEIEIEGSLLVNGTASGVVRFYSSSTNPSQDSWDQISFSGAKLEINYCAVSDASDGVFVYSTSSANTVKFDHCLFSNCGSGIVDFSNNSNVTVSYSTFLDNSYGGYDQWGENKKVAIDGCAFENITYGAIGLLSSNNKSPKAAIINLSKSNFLREGSLKFIDASSALFPPFNTTLVASGCYWFSGKLFD
jgi:hypothetical protein